jgi:hypothetical protein
LGEGRGMGRSTSKRRLQKRRGPFMTTNPELVVPCRMDGVWRNTFSFVFLSCS